jgi:hypothetical protein
MSDSLFIQEGTEIPQSRNLCWLGHMMGCFNFFETSSFDGLINIELQNSKTFISSLRGTGRIQRLKAVYWFSTRFAVKVFVLLA